MDEQKKKEKIIVIGSGACGIMTAWLSARAGYLVEIYSKSPDPRLEKGLDIKHESSTFDSKNDQRYITLYEGHPYLELEGYVNKVYPDIAKDFMTEVLEGGVLIQPFEQLSKRAQNWLKKRHMLNEKLLTKNKESIEKVAALFESYTMENRAAMEDWYLILIEFAEKFPDAAKALSLSANGIIRLYDNTAVYEQSLSSHEKENVLIKEHPLSEVIKALPSYKEGIDRGFISGGVIETYGLAFSIGVFCCAILDDIENNLGGKINFNMEAKKILLDKNESVEGISFFNDEKIYSADHYSFHTGAFSGPELFENIPEANNQLAAVEGYWITIENAEQLVAGMGNKPCKVHGKKNLKDILGMVDSDSADKYRKRFKECGIDLDKLDMLAPIVDFNNMPLLIKGQSYLGVGSGYVFKGLAERGNDGKVFFSEDLKSEIFVLAVMSLWLEALHGKTLIKEEDIVVHPVGCKRSYTINDKELDVNIPTSLGGVCMIEGGGNTGSTTKSPFIAKYILNKMQAASKQGLSKEAMLKKFAIIRTELSKSADEVPTSRWDSLTETLNHSLKNIF